MSDEMKSQSLASVIDSVNTPTVEAELYDKLRAYKKKIADEGTSEPVGLLSELIAFGLSEDYDNESSGWGTYYGPMMVWHDEKGNAFESPSIQQITEETLDYWKLRLEQATNPILVARYSDLVWEFGKNIFRERVDIRFARLAIDNIIRIAQESLCKYETLTVTKLKRALSLSLSINDEERKEGVIQSIIAFEDKIAEDNKPGLWGFSYDLLVANTKVHLIKGKVEGIICRLEDRLKRIAIPSGDKISDPFSAEAAAMRLLSYYKSRSEKENSTRVLTIYTNAYITAAKSASPLVATAWLEKVFRILTENGLTEKADEVARLLREYGKNSNDEMKTISHTVNISTSEINNYISQLTDGTKTDSLNRIAIHFIPKRKDIENQVKEMFKKAPLQGLITISIQDEGGKTVAKVGSVEKDLEGRIVYHLGQHLQISSYFLHLALNSAISKFSLNYKDICDHLYQSQLFDSDRRVIIEKGILSHINGDYIASICILVPEIESVLRRLLHLLGGSIYKIGRNGGLMERTLSEIIKDDVVASALKEDAVTYLSTLLADNRSWNLRNRVCHGLLNAESFNEAISNRMIHCMLMFSLIRIKEIEETQ